MKKFRLVLSAITLSILCSCSAAESRNGPSNAVNSAPQNAAANASAANSGSKIEITEGGPADTVRTFYQKLRDKRFREAIFMTNLRPAVQGLTDAELQEFSLDFEQLAGQVP